MQSTTAPNLAAEFKYESSVKVPQAFFLCVCPLFQYQASSISCPLINAPTKVPLPIIFASVVFISLHSLAAEPVWHLSVIVLLFFFSSLIVVLFVHRLSVISSLAFLSAR